MKRIICLITVLCLVLGSFSFCFAAVSDSQAASIVSDLSTIKTTLNNIYSRLGTIMNYLYDDGHSVGYWASAIASWMQPIYQALTNNLVSALDIEPIIAGLNEVVSSGGNTSYTPYLKYGGKSNANWLSDLYTLDNRSAAENYGGIPTLYLPAANGSYTSWKPNLSGSNWRNSLFTVFKGLNDNIAFAYSYEFNHRDNGYNATQSLVSFADPDSTVTFTPISATDGIYKYLNALNTPAARLAYVLASDSRIEAQEAAAANEQAVVDNFIDSTGDGYASPSDIGSISDLSSGYKSNFGTDANASDFFDIFDSEHFGWFSQETANSLDTTTPTRRGSSYNTPLLDQQIDNIYNALGVKHD